MNNPIRTIVSGGAGGQGGQFAQVLAESDRVSLVAVVEGYPPNLPLARERAESYGMRDEDGVLKCPVFTTLEDAMDQVECDLVISATLPEYHEREIIAALEKGKVVLCEKPPTLDLDGMRRVIHAERRSTGWVAYNFHLDRQTATLEPEVLDDTLGAPMTVRVRWVRSLVAAAEAEAMARTGTRRGQPTSGPMDDLCHVLRALTKFFPLGANIVAARGHSWSDPGSYEYVKATVRYPWTDAATGESREEEAHVSATAGWDIPLLGVGNGDKATLAIECKHGSASMRFLLDNRYRVGDEVPSEYYPQIRGVDHRGRIFRTVFEGPQPMSPFECLRAKVHDVVDLMLAGKRPAKEADGGWDIMALLEALRRSARDEREVGLKEIDPPSGRD